MTLVVARITPLGVRMAADMRVTDPSAIRRGYVHGALKLLTLSPTLCVGYAGNVDSALQAIREVASLDLTFDAARDRLSAEQVRHRRGEHVIGVQQSGARRDDAVTVGVRVVREGDVEVARHLAQPRHRPRDEQSMRILPSQSSGTKRKVGSNLSETTVSSKP